MSNNKKNFGRDAIRLFTLSMLSACYLTACGNYDERVGRQSGDTSNREGVKIISSSNDSVASSSGSEVKQGGQSAADKRTAGQKQQVAKNSETKIHENSDAKKAKGKASSSEEVITGVDKNGLRVESDSAAKSKVPQGDSKQLVEKAKVKAAEFEGASKAVATKSKEEASKVVAAASTAASGQKVSLASNGKEAPVAKKEIAVKSVAGKVEESRVEKAPAQLVSSEAEKKEIKKKVEKASQMTKELSAKKKTDLNKRLEQELAKFNETITTAQKNAKDVVEKAKAQISGKLDGSLNGLMETVQKELSEGGNLNTKQLDKLNTNVEQLIAGLEKALKGIEVQ